MKKLNIQKSKIMASGPITSWQIDKEKMEGVTNFIFLGSKIIADSDFSHEIKRHMLLGRKARTNLDTVLKRGAIILWTKVCIIKAMISEVVIYNVRVGLKTKLSTEELMLLNCGIGEDS